MLLKVAFWGSAQNSLRIMSCDTEMVWRCMQHPSCCIILIGMKDVVPIMQFLSIWSSFSCFAEHTGQCC